MERNLLKELCTNATIINKIRCLEDEKKAIQDKCYHIEVKLGEISGSKIQTENGLKHVVYSKCLLCDKCLTFEKDKIEKSFDLRNFRSKTDETYADLENKYIDALELFKSLYIDSNNLEQIYEKFSYLCENKSDDLKRAITKK